MRRSALLCRIVGIAAMVAVLLSLQLHAGMAMSAPADMGAAGAMLPADEGTMPSCDGRSEEHTSELQSLMRISYAVFCLKKKKQKKIKHHHNPTKTNSNKHH